MRITPEQTETIRSVAGPDVKVWLFGSCLDDARRGGDLDLLIASVSAAGLIQRARFRLLLEQVLQLPVDILATCFGAPDSAFVSIARAHAVQMDRTASSLKCDAGNEIRSQR